MIVTSSKSSSPGDNRQSSADRIIRSARTRAIKSGVPVTAYTDSAQRSPITALPDGRVITANGLLVDRYAGVRIKSSGVRK